MRALDAAVIAGLGLPGVALMELASRGVAERVERHHRAAALAGVAVVTGAGNNGGDGWAVARWLVARGFPVRVWSVAEPKAGTDAAVMASVARRMAIPEGVGVGGAGLVVDALFGTGLDRPLTGAFADAIDAIDAAGVPVVAVDVPSGLHADTGAALGRCVRATRTVTFGRTKVGMWTGSGLSRCGIVDVVDIGLGAATPADGLATAEIPDGSDLRWPSRPVDGHKGTHGHLVVIAGSAAMTGAAALVCRGALAGGAGLVTLVAARGMRARLAGLPPEVMVVDGGDGDHVRSVPDLGRFDAVAVGPGLGGGEPLDPGFAACLAAAWRDDHRPWVADADALPITGPSAHPRVLTPHPGEAARLLGATVAAVEADRLAAAARLSERGVALLKGPATVIAAAGASPSLNPTGAPPLSTGGSGDVLTGLLGALLARGLAPRDAARVAAFVHGRAGELLWAKRRDGWTASDVAAAIPDAAAELPTGGGRPGSRGAAG